VIELIWNAVPVNRASIAALILTVAPSFASAPGILAFNSSIDFVTSSNRWT